MMSVIYAVCHKYAPYAECRGAICDSEYNNILYQVPLCLSVVGVPGSRFSLNKKI